MKKSYLEYLFFNVATGFIFFTNGLDLTNSFTPAALSLSLSLSLSLPLSLLHIPTRVQGNHYSFSCYILCMISGGALYVEAEDHQYEAERIYVNISIATAHREKNMAGTRLP